MADMTKIRKETNRQDIQCLYTELLRNATPEQKEKALIAATAFLMGVSEKRSPYTAYPPETL